MRLFKRLAGHTRRVEPGVALLVKLLRGGADGKIGGVIGWFLAGRPREREGFKGGGRRVARIDLRATFPCAAPIFRESASAARRRSSRRRGR